MPQLKNFILFSLIIYARYVFVAGAFYLVCYRWKKKAWEDRRLAPTDPSPSILREEIKWSFTTSIVFGAVGAWMNDAWEKGQTQIYDQFSQCSIGYAVFSLFVMMVVHDTYFYWTHRLLHHPWWFRKIHRVHHLSIYPSPWAAFCFHPIEAVIEAGFLPLILFTVPCHSAVFLVFLLIMTVLGVVNHVGYELYPSVFFKNRILKTFISATNHSQHHYYTQCNYGLYFTWWDLLMKTTKKDRVVPPVVLRTSRNDERVKRSA